jgi:hypothetical protein
MVRNASPWNVIGLLLLDSLLKCIGATLVIFVCSAIVNTTVEGRGAHPLTGAFGTVVGFYRGLPFPFRSGNGLAYGIFFYASFFTSIWVWFYVVGGAVIKALVKTTTLWRSALQFIDLDGAPLKSIGRVVGVLLYIIYAFIFAVTRIAGSWS